MDDDRPTDRTDKRSEPRYEVATTVPAMWNGGPGTVECVASDISRHGIFLAMDAPPPVETPIRIGPEGIPGRVVFTLTAADAAAMGRNPGVGVQLETAIDPDAFLLRCAEERAARLAAGGDAASIAVAPAAAIRPPAAVRRPAPLADKADRPAELVTDVVLVDGVPGQALLAEALAADGYTPLVAKHGFEALVLCLRRRPLLCVAGAGAAGLGGRALLEVVREQRELDGVVLVLVDEADDPDPEAAGTVRWRAPPPDVARARRLVDAALGERRPRPRARGGDDPRALADAVAALARRLDDREAAIFAARYAAELAPTVPAHTLLLARMLLASPEQRRRDEAASLVERVVRQDPRSPEAYYLRACVLDQRGRRDEAQAALRRTLVFAPADEAALAALADLAAGKPLLAIEQPAPAPEGEKRGGLFGRLLRRPR